MTIDLSIFKDYDMRGIYPNQLNGDVAEKIGYGIIQHFHPKTVAIGRDMRLSGEEIKNGLATAFTNQGIDVYDMGLVGTEFMSYVSGTYDYDIVIMISASHNPPEYNGMKMSLKGAIAVSGKTGMWAVRDLITDQKPLPSTKHGTVKEINVYDEWKKKIQSFVDIKSIKPLSVVVDAGNGMAGKLFPYIYNDVPIHVTPLFFDLDGSFPNHTPNPLIEKNNELLMAKVKEINADIGLTFDGDADRLFIIDDKGRFVSGTITTALLARYLLSKYPNELLLYNAICGRIVPQTIAKYGGTSKRIRVGYSYIKQAMRETNALFTGEHSGHYFYRNFFNSESGVLTALFILELLTKSGKKLSELVDELNIYPASGEINFTSDNIPKIIEAINSGYQDADSKDEIDGISVWYPTYWFNVRASKTEPVIRLNVEADTKEILESKTKELMEFMQSMGAIVK